MRFLNKSYGCFLVGLGFVLSSPSALSQDMALNPYPTAERSTSSDDYEAFQADQNVIQELLARQAKRKRRAESGPVNLAGRPLKIYKTREEALRAKAQKETDSPDTATTDALPPPSAMPFSQFKKDKEQPVQEKTIQQWKNDQDTPMRPVSSQPNWVAPKAASQQTSLLPDAVDNNQQQARRNKIIPSKEPSKQPDNVNISPFYAIKKADLDRMIKEQGGQIPRPGAPVVDQSINNDAKIAHQEQIVDEIVESMAENADSAPLEIKEPDANPLPVTAGNESELPAFMHEQAMKRGLQSQAGMVVPAYTRNKQQASEAFVEQVYKEEVLIETKRKELEAQENAQSDMIIEMIETQAMLDDEHDFATPVTTEVVEHSNALLTQNFPGIPLGDETGQRMQSGDAPDLQAVSPAFVAEQGSFIESQWYGQKGQSAYEVLTRWSRNAGVDLIWNSQFLVDLHYDILISGSFESAVEDLLMQYEGLSAGVNGSLFVDDVSGKRTLVIETNQS